MTWFRRAIRDTYAEMRRRVIRETELGLLIGLRFPDRMPRIPTVEVGKEVFDPKFAEAFWEDTLGDMSSLLRFAKKHPELLNANAGPVYQAEDSASRGA
jgi:hypothetical protein